MKSLLKISEEQLNKALTIVVIENILLEIGEVPYQHVIHMINKEYHCGLTDCYEHPEYLRAVLTKQFGHSYLDIVRSIKLQLEEFSQKKSIGRFLEIISQ